MMKKILAVLLSLTMLLCALSACSSASSGASSGIPSGSLSPSQADSSGGSAAEQEVTLSIAWWGSQTRHDTTMALLKEYESMTPGIKFEAQYMGFDDYFPRLNTLVAAHNVYDVFQMGNNFLTYQDSLYPLNEYIESGVIDLSNANELFMKSGTLDGQILGIPLGVNAVCLVYDPEMFKQAGIPEPTNNWTWDDYMEASRKLHSELGVWNCGTQNAFWTGLATYVPQHGENVTAFTDMGDALGYEDDAFLADFFEMNRQLIAEGVQPSPSDLVDVTGLDNDFIVDGKAGMAWCNSNELVSLVKAAGRDLGIAVVPRLTADGLSGMFVKPTHHISISVNSKDKDACAQFINWILNDKEANIQIGGERGTSIVSDVREAVAANLTGAEKLSMEYIDTVSEIASTGAPREPIGQIEIENELNNIFEAVCMMQIAPDEAAAQFRAAAESIFARTAG